MKVWLIHTMAPFYGTDSYYKAYSEEDPSDWLYENWFNEECQTLWDCYSFHCESDWEDEWEELDEIEKEEVFENNWDAFMDNKFEEWCADCSMNVSESTEEECLDYVSGGVGDLEIIYDERNEKV